MWWTCFPANNCPEYAKHTPSRLATEGPAVRRQPGLEWFERARVKFPTNPNGALVRCQVTSSEGCVVDSREALLSVNPVIPGTGGYWTNAIILHGGIAQLVFEGAANVCGKEIKWEISD